LVIAEVELENENQTIELPKWIGLDVTNQNKYYNYNLALNPYISW
jgi:adenylate cyclase